MKPFRPHLLLALLLLTLPGVSGCAKEPMGGPRVETVPVTGRVLVDGEPVKGIAVLFLRVSDRGVDFPVPEPEGITDENGVITVGSYYQDDGGAPGTYKLCFVWGADSDRFRGKYDNKAESTFTVTIPEDVGDEPYDIGTIELSSEPPAPPPSESAQPPGDAASATKADSSPGEAPASETEPPRQTPPAPDSPSPPEATSSQPPSPVGEPKGAAEDLPDGVQPLNPQKTVLLDADRKRLLLKTYVVLREGVLEMFVCLAGTKEHESVLAVETQASVIHAGLLAIGAEPGAPVRFEPEYRPPQGQPIDVFVNWTDENGRPHRRPAQEWIRHVTRRYYLQPLEALPEDLTLPDQSELRYDEKRGQLIWFGPMSEGQRDELLTLSDDEAYQKAVRTFYEDSRPRQMQADFVFAGSGFHQADDGSQYYMAESGNVICVANFSDAIIDVDVKSASSNDALLFEPYTERIPPLGTQITVELVPRTDPTPAPVETQ